MLNSGVRAFVLRSERLPRDTVIELLKFSMPKMLKSIARYKPPFIFSIETDGRLNPLSDLVEL
jgi:hypothetical protein